MSKSISEILLDARISGKYTLDEVGKATGIDKALISKYERGIRKPSASHLMNLSNHYRLHYEELRKTMLSESIAYQLKNEANAHDILKLAESKVIYLKKTSCNKSITSIICDYLKKEDRVKRAWIFGSAARDQITSSSDIDLMVEYEPNEKIGLYDEIEIKHKLSDLCGREVDLVEKDMLKSFAWESAKHDIKLIYDCWKS